MPGLSTNLTSSSNNSTNSTGHFGLSGASPRIGGTTVPGSTLQPWLDICAIAYEGNWSVPQLQPCVDARGVDVKCSDLGTNIREANIEAIFDPTKPDNLINCGLWRIACNSVAMDFEFQAVWLQKFNVETFRSVGFEFPDENFTDFNGDMSMDWADCFGQLWTLVHPNQPTFQETTDSTSVPTICDTGLIFDEHLWYVNFVSCIDQLCNSKGWLNPDIGGIGVYASFILQTVLAIILFALIVTLERWPSLWKPQLKTSAARGSLKDRLLAANSEFYKAQCYFTGSIQIASIVLASQKGWTPVVDYGLFFTLATSGYGPVILNLLCVSRYGRSSWYFIMLATCCFLLSTTTLSFSQWYWGSVHNNIAKSFILDGGLANVSIEDSQSDIGDNIEYASFTCGGNSATTILQKWCDTPTPVATGTQVSIILSGWNWVLWSICLLWLSHCFFAKWHDRPIVTLTSPAPQGRVSRCVRYIRSRRFPPTPKPFKYIWWFSFAISWPLLLGYQLYLYSLFFTSSQINTEWSFGQIVAITVWAPCLADFILVLREGIPLTYHFRLPKGFNVVKEKELPPLPSQD